MAGRSRPRLTTAYIGVGVLIEVLANIVGNAFNLIAWRWWLVGTTILVVVALITLELVRDRGDGGPEPGLPAPVRPSSWQVPHLVAPIERPRLITELLGALDTTGGVVGLTTALAGTGGFGKTTLAAMVCLRPDVQAAFPGGMLWATIGNDRSDAELSVIINDLAAQLTGSRPDFAVPEQAGRHLGGLLDEMPRNLLILDDVWTSDQLRPFLFGSATTSRLITTRNQSCLPYGARVLTVEQMEQAESQNLLARGLREHPASLRSLVLLTGRWPLLMDMVNSALQRLIADGQAPESAAQALAAQLTTDGPTFLDIRTSSQRRSAVRATVAASLRLLDRGQAARYTELGIFAEDSDVPVDVLSVLWQLEPGAAQRLCQELSDLSLVKAYHPGSGVVRLHDVLRDHLRHELGPRLPEVNRAFLDHAREALLPAGGSQWWLLPRRVDYLWQNLAYHLREAGAVGELNELLLDLRWADRRIQQFGLASLESDMTRGTEPRLDHLRQALARKGHLLKPVDPPHALADILVSRLAEVPELAGAVEAFSATLPHDVARLSNRWPIPPVDPALVRVLSSYTEEIPACAVAADGRWIAGAGADHVIRVWDTTSWAVRALLSAHGAGVTAIEAAPDGTWVVTTGRDGTTRVWDTASWTEQVCLSSKGGRPVTGCAIAPNETWIATTAADGVVEVWDTTSFSSRLVFPTGHGEATDCAVSADGRWLATTGADRAVRVWETDGWESVAELRGHTGRTLSCVFEPGGRWLASTGEDSSVRIWDTAEWGESRAMRHGNADAVPSCAVSSDGAWLVSTGTDRTVRVWDTSVWTDPIVQLGHTDTVTGCAVFPAGTRFVTSGADGNLRLWEAPGAERHAGTRSQNRPARRCAVAPDASWLAVLTMDQTVYLWRGRAPAEPFRLTADLPGAVRLAVGPEPGWLVTGSGKGTFQVWETATGRLRADIAAHGDAITALAVSADGTWLLTGSAGGGVRIWDVATLTGRIHLPGHTPGSPIADCAFSPDGRLLLTCGEDGVAQVWTTDWRVAARLSDAVAPAPSSLSSGSSPPSESQPSQLSHPARSARSAQSAQPSESARTVEPALSQQSVTLLTGTIARSPKRRPHRRTAPGYAVLPDQFQPEPLAARSADPDPDPDPGPASAAITACCVSPDSRLAAIARADGTVQVWDAAGGAGHRRLDVADEPLTACAFAPDGAWLAVTGGPAVQVWSTRTWTRAAVMPTNGPAWDLSWVPGTLDLAVGGAGGIYLFRFTAPDPG